MPPADRVPGQHAPRKPLPGHLLRDENVCLPAATDYAFRGNLKQLGEDG